MENSYPDRTRKDIFNFLC